MPLPLTVTEVSIDTTYTDWSGNPRSGTVTFVAPGPLRVPGEDLVLTVSPKTFTLDANGRISGKVLASSDPDAFPLGFTYTVTESFPVQGDTPAHHAVFQVSIPHDHAGILSLADVTRLTDAPQEGQVGTYADELMVAHQNHTDPHPVYASDTDLAALVGRVDLLEGGATVAQVQEGLGTLEARVNALDDLLKDLIKHVHVIVRYTNGAYTVPDWARESYLFRLGPPPPGDTARKLGSVRVDVPEGAA